MPCGGSSRVVLEAILYLANAVYNILLQGREAHIHLRYSSFLTTNPLMLWVKVIAICCEKNSKHMCTMCDKMQYFSVLWHAMFSAYWRQVKQQVRYFILEIKIDGNNSYMIIDTKLDFRLLGLWTVTKSLVFQKSRLFGNWTDLLHLLRIAVCNECGPQFLCTRTEVGRVYGPACCFLYFGSDKCGQSSEPIRTKC
jgi:hypothetical protein